MRISSLLASALLLVACSTSIPATDEHATHSDDSSMAHSSMDRLSDSPRHQEWAEVKRGDRTIHTFVVYPQVSGKAPVVVLIHENKGLNDWARSMADQVAEGGAIAVAPDLLSQFDATHERTSDFATPDDATKAINQLKPENVMADLRAVVGWAQAIPAANDKLVSAGFCWGGSQSFSLAANSSDLDAALVFYGTGPKDPETYGKISTPVFGFYGGADERVNATIEGSAQAMSSAGKSYDYHIYDGAGHAFMRLGEDPAATPQNKAARDAAWERMQEILKELE